MNDSERTAFAYLQACGYRDIRYEPDGNVPPDFLVDGRIAVEVRRLNQAHDDGLGPRGLEEVQFPLLASMENLLRSLGPPRHGRSWFVDYRFSRPVPSIADLRRRVRNALLSTVDLHDAEEFKFDLGDDFHLTVFPSSSEDEDHFMLAGWDDDQDGGWVLAELEVNLKRCVAEKVRKVAPHRPRYPIWWLILVDHIAYAQVDNRDQDDLRAGLDRGTDFDRVVLIHPTNAMRSFEAWPREGGIGADAPSSAGR